VKEHEATYRNVRIEGKYHFGFRPIGSPGKKEGNEGGQSPLSNPWRGFAYCFSEGDEKLVGRSLDKAKYHEGVTVKAGSRFFIVNRSSPQGLYRLNVATVNEFPPKSSATPALVKEALYCPWNGSDFPSVVNSPEFKIGQVTRTGDSTNARVNVTFSYRPVDSDKPKMEGWVRLDPAANCVLTDYEIKRTSPPSAKSNSVTEESGSTRYKDENGVALPVEVRYKKVFHTPKGDTLEEGEYQIDRFVLGPTPAEEFTLAYYGLGDFEVPSRRSASRAGYYALALAVAAGLVSLVMARLARKVTRKPVEASSLLKPADADGAT
jgi:hypothetical protein